MKNNQTGQADSGGSGEERRVPKGHPNGGQFASAKAPFGHPRPAHRLPSGTPKPFPTR